MTAEVDSNENRCKSDLRIASSYFLGKCIGFMDLKWIPSHASDHGNRLRRSCGKIIGRREKKGTKENDAEEA